MVGAPERRATARQPSQQPPAQYPPTQRPSAQPSRAQYPPAQPSQAQPLPAQYPPTRRKVSAAARAQNGARERASSAPPPARTRPEPRPGGRRGKATRPRRRRRHPWRSALLVVLVALIAWPTWLLFYTNSHLQRTPALVDGEGTPGQTYLLTGSDKRAPGQDQDTVHGERTDSIVMLHKAANGQTAMISFPRDTYVEIPGYGMNKINAAFTYGGAPLLVETVQNLTGLHVDHYAQINMQGFGPLVDSVGGVNLCLDFDAQDDFSGLDWTAGCHDTDGETALAFARMRYADPRGDIGRAERQRQVISAVAKNALSPTTIFNPVQQLKLARTGTETLTVDESMNVIDIARMMLTFRAASGGELNGTPPLASISASTDVGSVVLLNDQLALGFFERLRAGELTPADFQTTY